MARPVSYEQDPVVASGVDRMIVAMSLMFSHFLAQGSLSVRSSFLLL